MKQVDKISISELKKMSVKMFGGLVKAVVDVEKEIFNTDLRQLAGYTDLTLINVFVIL